MVLCFKWSIKKHGVAKNLQEIWETFCLLIGWLLAIPWLNSPNWLKYNTRAHCYMLIRILMRHFLKYFLGQILSKNLLEEQARRSSTMMRKCAFKQTCFYRGFFFHFSFAHKQFLKFCVYIFVFGATSKLPVLCNINCSIQISECLYYFVYKRAIAGDS